MAHNRVELRVADGLVVSLCLAGRAMLRPFSLSESEGGAAMPQAQPAPARYPERQEIADALQAITDQIIALLHAEVDAVLKADM